MNIVTLDVDGTLLGGNCFQIVLDAAGQGDAARALFEAWQAGQKTYEATWRELWALYQPLALQDAHRALRKDADWLPDITEGVRRLRAAGLEVVVCSDLPSTITDFLGRWGLSDALASPVVMKEGVQRSITPQFDRAHAMSQRFGATAMTDICHVGNGPLDVPVWNAVGCKLSVDAIMADDVDAVVDSPKSFLEIAEAVLSLQARKLSED